MTSHRRASTILDLAARGLTLVVFVLWALFFVEHVEWLTDRALPPRVWLAQLAHLVLLAGLLAEIRWRRAGALLTVGALVSFFALAGWPRATWLFVLTLTPALLFTLAQLAHRQPSAVHRP